MRFAPIFLALTVAASAGCKKPKTVKDEPTAAGSTTDLSSDRSMQVMNYYVEFFNDMIDDVPDLTSNYWDRAGEAGLDAETMGKWGNVICAGAGWMKMKRDEAKERVAQVERQSSGEFAKMPPMAKAVYDTAIAHAEKRDAMCAYVKGGGWKTDSAAAAKTHHAELVKTKEAFNAAIDTLGNELERVEDAQSNAELKKHEAKQSYGYWYRFATIRTNQWLRTARRDGAKAEAALPALKEALAAFTGFASKATGAHASFTSFAKQVDRMTAAVAKLEPALAKAKTPAEKSKVVDAAMEDLISIYNTMVSLHNTLTSQAQ